MKILFLGDSPTLHTGFATVLKKIMLYLVDNTNWNIKCIGWFDKDDAKNLLLPFDIIKTNGNIEDVYGEQTFNELVQSYNPDIVFAIGDEWMIKHLTTSPYRKSYILILYVPIDGCPIPKQWIETFKNADVFVAYNDWAKKVIQHRDNSFSISVIPHGVDTNVFCKKEVVRRHPFNTDSFIIGCVARNQPRKNLPAFIKMMSIFVTPWLKCFNCNSVTYIDNIEEQKCSVCNSIKTKVFNRKKDVFGYIHCAINDCGWDLPDIISRFDLRKQIVFPKNIDIGSGVTDENLSEIYNMMNVFTLPTTGEGFGLPILEAMACGLPCLVTNYSAHLDYCYDSAELINVGYYLTEPQTNIERALVDIDDYVMKLERLYYDKETFIIKYGEKLNSYGITDFSNFIDGKEIRKNLGEVALNKAKSFDWKFILPIWKSLFESLENQLKHKENKDECRIEKV